MTTSCTPSASASSTIVWQNVRHRYAGSLPDTITIYREALLEVCEDEHEVVDEVAVTVIHELAHHFGIDDDRLHELGWA